MSAVNPDARCMCGHYRREHDFDQDCGGAYSTLMADADDREFVEVRCPCDAFVFAEPDFHVVRP